MQTAENLKVEINSKMERLSVDSLRSVSDYASYLWSKTGKEGQSSAQEDEQTAIQRYIEGYQEHPETDAEVAATFAANQAALAAEPWE